MIIILRGGAGEGEIKSLIDGLERQQLKIHYSKGEFSTIIGLVGDTSVVDIEKLKASNIVENVTRVSEPFKAANRKFHSDDTVVEIGGKGFGRNKFSVIAGPCSVESEEQITEVAEAVKKAGASYLRGGAFKPRTSPYAFQGKRDEGLKMLIKAKKHTGLPLVTEIMSESTLDLFEDIDIIQVGARNMQNFELLKELGKCNKPILIKRGMSNTVEELLMSAEYIMASGNSRVILCERGIRTYEKYTRNTLDISAVPIIKRMSHLPVIVDPSHASGLSELVLPLAKAAVVSGADGLMIEVHNNPSAALSDGRQSITPLEFELLMSKVKQLVALENKEL